MGDLEVEEPGCGLLDTYLERDAFSKKALVNLVESTSRMIRPFLLKRSPHFSPNLCGDVVRFYRFSSEKCLRYDINKTGVFLRCIICPFPQHPRDYSEHCS
jgi:hypothetical protein